MSPMRFIFLAALLFPDLLFPDLLGWDWVNLTCVDTQNKPPEGSWHQMDQAVYLPEFTIVLCGMLPSKWTRLLSTMETVKSPWTNEAFGFVLRTINAKQGFVAAPPVTSDQCAMAMILLGLSWVQWVPCHHRLHEVVIKTVITLNYKIGATGSQWAEVIMVLLFLDGYVGRWLAVGIVVTHHWCLKWT